MKPLETIYWLRLALGITAAIICITYNITTGTIFTNLILNPSVEIGTATPEDWFSSGIGTEWSTAYARTGSRSIRMNVTNATVEWRSKIRPAHEEHKYQVHGFFAGEVTADQFFLTVRWFSDSEGLDFMAENNISIPVGSYPEWSRLGDDFTAPNEAKSYEIVFKAVNGSGNIYGDDFEVRQAESLTNLMTCISLALVTYLISYYIIKLKFINKVEKPQKLVTTGIGIYFISWIVFWSLLYTLIVSLL